MIASRKKRKKTEKEAGITRELTSPIHRHLQEKNDIKEARVVTKYRVHTLTHTHTHARSEYIRTRSFPSEKSKLKSQLKEKTGQQLQFEVCQEVDRRRPSGERKRGSKIDKVKI